MSFSARRDLDRPKTRPLRSVLFVPGSNEKRVPELVDTSVASLLAPPLTEEPTPLASLPNPPLTEEKALVTLFA